MPAITASPDRTKRSIIVTVSGQIIARRIWNSGHTETMVEANATSTRKSCRGFSGPVFASEGG